MINEALSGKILMFILGFGVVLCLFTSSLSKERSGPPVIDVEIDISSLSSQVILGAERQGRETVIHLTDGRIIVVGGHKGHRFYERRFR